MRYDAGGSEVAVNTATSPDNALAWSAVVVGDGSYVGVLFHDTVELPSTRVPVRHTAAGSKDSLIVKLDARLQPVWATRFGGSQADEVRALAPWRNGGVLAFGFFEGRFSFGEGAARRELAAMAEADLFLLALDASGELRWVRTFGGPAYDVAHAITALDDGGCLITGSLRDAMTFGEGKTLDPVPVSELDGMSQSFVARYDANGRILWVERLGGMRVDSAAIAESASRAWLAGAFQGSITAEPWLGMRAGMHSAGGYDVFVARFAP